MIEHRHAATAASRTRFGFLQDRNVGVGSFGLTQHLSGVNLADDHSRTEMR